jgi:hypothetical protein
VRRIGVLAGSAESTEVRAHIAAFRLALQNLGWREDHNIRIDIRWLGSDPQLIQAETTTRELTRFKGRYCKAEGLCGIEVDANVGQTEGLRCSGARGS